MPEYHVAGRDLVPPLQGKLPPAKTLLLKRYQCTCKVLGRFFTNAQLILLQRWQTPEFDIKPYEISLQFILPRRHLIRPNLSIRSPHTFIMGLSTHSNARLSTSEHATKQDQKPATANLPSWAQDAMKEDTLSQPWKQHTAAETDDPNFAQGKDTITFYDSRIKVCYGEGSLAA